MFQIKGKEIEMSMMTLKRKKKSRLILILFLRTISLSWTKTPFKTCFNKPRWREKETKKRRRKVKTSVIKPPLLTEPEIKLEHLKKKPWKLKKLKKELTSLRVVSLKKMMSSENIWENQMRKTFKMITLYNTQCYLVLSRVIYFLFQFNNHITTFSFDILDS